jgi:photosystem II stability/assembly factor-like uncharacterized protein
MMNRIALLLLSTLAFAQETPVWSGMRYRMIGPERGGRVTAVTGVPSQPNTYYMGSTGGGVWKTTDAGHTWANISDGFFSVGSMGAIEVAPSDPNVIYAGTGSSKIRSNVSIGRGAYRSADAGKTWTFIGLRDVGQISTLRVHPTDPDMVYVAALGNPFVPSKERGVYRSMDGGKTWKNVLFVSETLGAADLEIQPGNPKVLFATLWHGQRKPWTIVSGAHEGGIYKSIDGGDSWNKLAGGLPNELFGRANVSISASKPNRIYALIEAKPGAGLYRSEDAGATWSLVNGQGSIITRPFYYDTLAVDPTDAEVVWVGDEGWFKSTDGGKTFRRSPTPHGDNQDIWINPKNSQYMIQSNDGGANVSLDGGRTWSTQMNQPTAEIYQVAVDDQYPYRVYGAQQDNTTVIVPNLSLGNGQDFRIGPGCETGPIIPNRVNPELVYGSCKGQFSTQNMNTANEQRYWVGAQSLYGNAGSELIYRFQRVSPMEVSPHDPKVVYYGSQFVHRTRDGGVTWEKISPDLTAHPPGTQGASGEPITRDATGEEVYSTLYTIRESPVQRGVIWTGSNDGPIYVTRDDGKTWANVTPAGLTRTEHRAESASRGKCVCGHLSIFAGRLRALHLSHRRLRQNLDALDRWQERNCRGRADESCPRRSGSRGLALRRHRVRHAHLLRQWRAVAAVPDESSRNTGDGHQGRAQRPGGFHAGPVVLDIGRSDDPSSSLEGNAHRGGVVCAAGRGALTGTWVWRGGRRRSAIRFAVSTGRCGRLLLPGR